MPRTIIVVPCFNEALRLDVSKLRAFARENSAERFLLVNDGSTDGTRELLDALQRGDPECFWVRHLPANVGKAEAVRLGLLQALGEGAEYVGYWDADLATPLDTIATFRSVLDSRPDIDMVFGARVCLLGRSVERDLFRHYLGRVFATAASLALGVRFYDTQCGAKLFRASPDLAALLQEPFRTRWIFDVEILARWVALRRGTGQPRIEAAVYEYPLHEWRDVPGSKVRPGDFVAAFVDLATIHWRYLRANRHRGGARAWPRIRKANAVQARPVRVFGRRAVRHANESTAPFREVGNETDEGRHS